MAGDTHPTPSVALIGSASPFVTAIQSVVSSLGGTVIRATDDATDSAIKMSIMAIVVPGADRERAWTTVNRLLDLSFRDRIVVVSGQHPAGDDGFRGLEAEGVHAVEPDRLVPVLLSLLAPCQFPSRSETRHRAALHDAAVLAQIAGGNRHPIPQFSRVRAFVCGSISDGEAAMRELVRARAWLSHHRDACSAAGQDLVAERSLSEIEAFVRNGNTAVVEAADRERFTSSCEAWESAWVAAAVNASSSQVEGAR